MGKSTTRPRQIPPTASNHLRWCAAEDDFYPCVQSDGELFTHREPWFWTPAEDDATLRLRLVRRDWSDGRRDPVGIDVFISIDGAEPTKPADVATLTVAEARAWGATLLAFAERASA